MSWSNDYVGIPFSEKGRDRAGVDCWGVACLVYLERLDILLPFYDDHYGSTLERLEINAAVVNATAARPWHRVTAPRPYDILSFSIGGFESHIGIFVQPGLMLHAAQGRETVIESFLSSPWDRRFTAIYRHEAVR